MKDGIKLLAVLLRPDLFWKVLVLLLAVAIVLLALAPVLALF